jgi:hypothetical protein
MYNQAPFAAPAPAAAATPSGGVQWYSAGPSAYPPDAAYAYGGGAAAGSGAAYGSFDEEPPLLEELGVDVPAILRRARAILALRPGSSALDDLDAGGPLVLMAALGAAHLLSGKLHFGYILGWTVLGSSILWFVLSAVAAAGGGGGGEGGGGGGAGRLDLYSVCCLAGYSLLPLVLHAAAALLLPRRSRAAAAGGAVAVAWAGWTASRLFQARAPGLRGQGPVVLYPCLLMYSAFALLTLY